MSHPREPRSWTDQTTTCPNTFFLFHQEWSVEVPWEGKTSRGGLDQCSGGYSGVISGFSRIVQNLVEPQFISQHPYTSGTCSFGSKLSIHVLSQGSSVTDLSWTCLLYLRGDEVKFAESEIGQNKFTASIFTRPPYTFGTSPFGSELSIHALWVVFCFKNFGWSWQLSSDQVKVRQNWSKCGKSDPAISVILIICLLKLGLKTLYTSMTNAFSPIRPKLKFTLTSDAVKFFPISTVYFGRPLARLLGLRWRPCN